MANSIQLARASLIFLRHNQTFFKLNFKTFTIKPPNSHLYSTTATPYPLQYDMIVSRPANSPPPASRRRRPSPPLNSRTPESAEQNPDSELGFNDWVDQKLLSTSSTEQQVQPNLDKGEMDKSKRKYYNKREKRMYGGSDSDNEGNSREGSKFVEMKQEVVELRTLHKKEEELYFYDAFAYPWEKDKHYKMVYQLEKKYFPDQGFDKAFLEPGQSNTENAGSKNRKWVRDKGEERKDEKGMMFFEEESKSEDKEEVGLEKEVKMEVTEKKVEEFFKCLKKVPNKDGEVTATGPFLSSRSRGLPPKWDSPTGTVALINKPKGWTSFTVCGKLRRVVNVKKVGHAGTLDPMATGLLIVCVGKATKLMESYQGMIKGYSGVIRLGEATSTLDADSPVIQREPWEHIKDEDIRKAATSFCGEIWQVPPMFSAIKKWEELFETIKNGNWEDRLGTEGVGGERMYEKARRGESIELAPRRISIYNFDLERSLDDRQNVIFKVTCSKGTYIRSLCADLAKALGSCAHLTALRRDSIGEYSADDAWEFKELEEAVTKGYL